ncbi:MAG: hypothetical protein R3B45_11515 [Bdellovibrionota bacterium]
MKDNRMGKIIKFPTNHRFQDQITKEVYPSYESALSEFMEKIETKEFFQAGVPLSWLLHIGVPTATKFAKIYHKKIQKEPAIKEDLAKLALYIKSSSANDFIHIMHKCFDVQGTQAINLYIQIKKNIQKQS